MKLTAKIFNITDRISGVLAFIAGIITILLLLSVSADVFMRYFLRQSMEWVAEYCEYSMLFITFMGAAWVLKKGAHVNIDMILTRLNPKTQEVVNIITTILSAAVFFVVAWFGVKVTWQMLQINYLYDTPLKTPRFIILSVIPIGSALLFIGLLRNTLEQFNNWKAAHSSRQKVEAKS